MKEILTERRTKTFWNRVNKTKSCWLWQTCLERNGYARMFIGNKRLGVHVVSYLLTGRTIPIGHVIDHLCRTRNCVNPDHLEVVTRGENVLRGIGVTAEHARQTKCKRGHFFDKQNTYYIPNGGRDCKKCCRIRQQEYLNRKKFGGVIYA